jgi:hypothetical protein
VTGSNLETDNLLRFEKGLVKDISLSSTSYRHNGAMCFDGHAVTIKSAAASATDIRMTLKS